MLQPPSRGHAAPLIPLILAVTLAACSSAGAPSAAPSTATAAPPASSAPVVASATPSAVPPSAQPSTAGIPPELLDRVRNLAAADTGLDPTAIVIVSAEKVVWKDGSLDCPKIGVMYTQGLEDGYHIVVKAGPRTLDYRWGRVGDPRLCPPRLAPVD
jgi:hypothetical protein